MEVWQNIETQLQLDWSPEQIADLLQREKCYDIRGRRSQLADRIIVDVQTAFVAQRSPFGEWELDTMIGKGHQQVIVSLTERKGPFDTDGKGRTQNG